MAKKGSQDDLKESSSMRIQKALAQLGVGSRRGIEKAIQENRIEVNNAPAHVGQAVSSKDKIVFDGKYTYYSFNLSLELVVTIQ